MKSRFTKIAISGNSETEKKVISSKFPKFDVLYLFLSLPAFLFLPFFQNNVISSTLVGTIISILYLFSYLILKVWFYPTNKYTNVLTRPVIITILISIFIASLNRLIFEYSQNQVFSLYGFSINEMTYFSVLLFVIFAALSSIVVYIRTLELTSPESRYAFLRSFLHYLQIFLLISITFKLVSIFLFKGQDLLALDSDNLHFLEAQIFLGLSIGIFLSIHNLSYFQSLVNILFSTLLGFTLICLGNYALVVAFVLAYLILFGVLRGKKLLDKPLLFLTPLFVFFASILVVSIINLSDQFKAYSQSRLSFAESYEIITNSKFEYSTIFWGHGHAYIEEVINMNVLPTFFSSRSESILISDLSSSFFKDILERGTFWTMFVVFSFVFVFIRISKLRDEIRDSLFFMNASIVLGYLFTSYNLIWYLCILVINLPFLFATQTNFKPIKPSVSIMKLSPLFIVFITLMFGFLIIPGDVVTIVKETLLSNYEYTQYRRYLSNKDLVSAYNLINKLVVDSPNDPFLKAEQALLSLEIFNKLSKTLNNSNLSVDQKKVRDMYRLNQNASVALKSSTELIAPKSVRLWIIRSQYYSGLEDRFSGASEQVLIAKKELVLISPKNPKLNYELAEEYLKLEKFDDSISVLKYILQIKQDYADAIILLSKLYTRLGKYEDALRTISLFSKVQNKTPQHDQEVKELWELITEKLKPKT